MPVSRQLFLSILPYLVTVVLLISIVQPSLTEAYILGEQVDTSRKTFEDLSEKIKNRQQLIREKLRLDNDIEKLRSSLPRAPELDMLLLDIEKMSEQSHTDLIGLEPRDDSKKEKPNNFMESLLAEVEGRLPINTLQQKQQKKAIQPNAPKKEEPEDPDANPFGLRRVERRIFVSGDFNELNSFLKRLEAYRRVVGVEDLIVASPESEDRESVKTLASERGSQLAVNKPIMTFLMNIYYLP
ncbi:MAG: hypothetical protein K2Z81_22535 [Cyanobacteria bacterium]|nr:hypothetical protein [Cyanobacteriota bacterium]